LKLGLVLLFSVGGGSIIEARPRFVVFSRRGSIAKFCCFQSEGDQY
jgi:hypothetical protein